MCFDNDDVGFKYSNNSIRKARKQHQCHECGALILPGQIYNYFSGLNYDYDKPYSLKTCGVCELTRYMIHLIELSEGCDSSDSWCYEDLYYYADEYNVPPMDLGLVGADDDRDRERYTVAEGQRFMLFSRAHQIAEVGVPV